MGSETAQKNLETALATTGRSVKDMLPDLTKFADEIMKQTIVDDEAAKGALTLMVQLTNLDKQGLQTATKGAIGLARVFSVDLESAARIVAKGMSGDLDLLARYIPQIRSVKTEQEKHALVMQQLGAWYQRATAETGTFSGQLSQLKNWWGEVKEAVGKAITENEGIRDLLQNIKEKVIILIESGKLAEWVDNIRKAIESAVPLFEKLVGFIFKVTEGAATAGPELMKMMREELLIRLEKAREKLAALGKETGDYDVAIASLSSTLYGHDLIITKVGETYKDTRGPINETGTAIGGLTQKVKETAKPFEDLRFYLQTLMIDLKDFGKNATRDWIDYMNTIGGKSKEIFEGLIDEVPEYAKQIKDTTKNMMEEISTVVSDAMRNIARSIVDTFGLIEILARKPISYEDTGVAKYFKKALDDLEKDYEAKKHQINLTITDEEEKYQALQALGEWYKTEQDRIRNDEDNARDLHAKKEEHRQNSLWEKVKGIFVTAINEMATVYLTRFITNIISGSGDAAKGITDTLGSAVSDVSKSMAGLGTGIKELLISIAEGIAGAAKVIAAGAKEILIAAGVVAAIYFGFKLLGSLFGGGGGGKQGDVTFWLKLITDNTQILVNYISTDFLGYMKALVEGIFPKFDDLKASVDLTRDSIRPMLEDLLGQIRDYTYGTWDAIKNISKFQGGYEGVVSRPTLFIAGERGAERVTITPSQQNFNVSGGVIRVILEAHGRVLAETIAPYMPEITKDGRMKIHTNSLVSY